RVEALSLGYAPAPGFSRVLEAGALLRQVRAAAPGIDVKIAGAGTCRVSPDTELICADAITSAALAALQKHLAARDLGDCTLELASAVAAVEVPKGKQACALEVAPQAAKSNPGPTLVAVRLVVDGQTYRTVYTSWKVQAWREQPVLLRPVHAGELIDSSMVELRRAPIDAALAQSALDSVQVLGTAAARELPAGKTLSSGDLVRPTVVKKGDALILVVNSGAVHVRTPVTAEQSGALGDRIKVVVQQSGRELNAVIATRDTVRVDLGDRKQAGTNR
ncbi:MAG TPA: flagellar basal body P-ring formation chaperone FlgA, partial [Planctomycetota bacterium]|nr:flagellar basal body P-ring formation chaperone FlgA [Planctomycetota bacterium]